MSRENYADVNAVCPFYQGITTSKQSSIICESVVPTSHTTSLNFNKAHKRDVHMEEFCNKNYKECPLYGLINSKYE